MKKKFFYLFLISSILLSAAFFISCKNNTTETKLVYTENNTIKQSVKEKEQDITWTLELDEDRLLQDVTRNSVNIDSTVVYNSDLMKIINSYRGPVYPEIEDFGSLDTSRLNPATREKITNFCNAISDTLYSGGDAFFSKKYLFNYVFFRNELISQWEENFGEEFPEDYNKEIKKQENNTDSEKSDLFETTKKRKPLFNKWIFGAPFIGSELLQIPVRFFTDCGIIDMTLFLSSSGNNEFYQITIDRWKKYDGTQ